MLVSILVMLEDWKVPTSVNYKLFKTKCYILSTSVIVLFVQPFFVFINWFFFCFDCLTASLLRIPNNLETTPTTASTSTWTADRPTKKGHIIISGWKSSMRSLPQEMNCYQYSRFWVYQYKDNFPMDNGYKNTKKWATSTGRPWRSP